MCAAVCSAISPCSCISTGGAESQKVMRSSSSIWGSQSDRFWSWSIFFYPQIEKSTRLGPGGNRLYWDPARRHSPWPGPTLEPGSEARPRAGPCASEPGPRAGLGPGLCLRAGSQYSLFPHGPNIIDFWKYPLECTLFASPILPIPSTYALVSKIGQKNTAHEHSNSINL